MRGVYAAIGLVWLVALVGCSNAPSTDSTGGDERGPDGELVVTVAKLCANPDAYHDKFVRIVGEVRQSSQCTAMLCPMVDAGFDDDAGDAGEQYYECCNECTIDLVFDCGSQEQSILLMAEPHLDDRIGCLGCETTVCTGPRACEIESVTGIFRTGEFDGIIRPGFEVWQRNTRAIEVQRWDGHPGGNCHTGNN